MPTENRSSNTAMVSDSEMTECQFHNNCGGWCETRRELEYNLCEHCLESHDEEMSEPAPGPQLQTEPATPYGWHVEWADSGDHYLFTKVEKRIEALRLDSDVKVVQLYTHADPGEIERLRSIARAYDLREELLQQVKAERDRMIARTCELSSQLDERDALLQDLLDYDISANARRRIEGALSGNAESGEIMMDHLMDIATQQLVTIARTTAYHCDEQHEYMKGAGGTDWLPHKWVVEAMRAAVTIRNTQAEDMVREELHQALAKLAKAHALLRHLYDNNELSLGDDQRILTVLSASAEPSTDHVVEANEMVRLDEHVCKGAPELGNACGRCRRCIENALSR